MKWARGEVGRAVSVFRWAAEEARRFNSGEAQRLDTDPGGVGRLALTRRFGRGPVLGIAPFNFPLNLVAHKVAPAIAVGAPIILKPAPATPLSALLLGELLAETERAARGRLERAAGAERPDGRTGPGPAAAGDLLHRLRHRRATRSWTRCPASTSPWSSAATRRPWCSADWSCEPDLEWAATRIATFANYQGGQSCISVQRVIADASVYDALAEKVVAKVRAQVTGDPSDDATDVGPLVSEAAAAARRATGWTTPCAKGAKLLTGGVRDGATYAPTVLADLPADAVLATAEAFGPVLSLHRVNGADEAFAAVNDSRFGLQSGVFTHDLQLAFRAHRELEVGGVIIGDAPSYRADQMPYGGVKDSGNGREGVKYAMEDYTYERVMVLTGLDL